MLVRVMDADCEQLAQEVASLRSENAELKATVDRLTRHVEKLTAALEEARRAASDKLPFLKKAKPRKPKKPGRKQGDQYGDHARRAVPTAK